MENNTLNEIEILNKIISMLADLDEDSQRKVLSTVATFYEINGLSNTVSQVTYPTSAQNTGRGQQYPSVPFSDAVELSPKEFLREKVPQTDVERIACLAYFLTHYRDTPHFKTIDLSKLNTEAAQPKFSNAAQAAGNALQYGYLAQSTKGCRQLSAVGEDYVSALPDRDLAKATIVGNRQKRKNSLRKKNSPKIEDAAE